MTETPGHSPWGLLHFVLDGSRAPALSCTRDRHLAQLLLLRLLLLRLSPGGPWLETYARV